MVPFQTLVDVREYFADRADADGKPDGGFVGNVEMALLSDIDEALSAALVPPRDEIVEALRKLCLTARILLQNAEGCAVNHHGIDHEIHGMPGWLADCAKDIERAEAALQKLEGKS